MKLDQHFTDQEAAIELVDSLLTRLDPLRVRRYIEPSCGGGSFVEALHKAGVHRRRIRSVEIDPSYEADVHGDFLTSTRESLGIAHWPVETTVVVGNPPFGNNGKTAREFLNKASDYANWVCFVVPRSLHGAHGCTTVDARLELIYEKTLAAGCFSSTKAKCNWQEWFRLPQGQTGYRPKVTEPDTKGLYTVVDVNDEHDIVLQRCGGTAGRVTTCNGTGQGKYYIRSPYPEVVLAFSQLGEHEGADLTTHQKSLSARMLHELLERSLLDQYIQQIKV